MSEMQMGEGFVGVIDRLKAEGNLTRNSGANSIKRLTATVEELVTKQDESNEISKNAAEESEKQDMFQRFDEEEESKQVAEVVEDKDKDKDEEGGGFMKSFGGFFKMLKGFVGILLAVAALESLGLLFVFATILKETISLDLLMVLFGFASAVIDNVPLVAASLGMFTEFAPDDQLWHFLAYCAGTGGSMLIIGSAAGVVAMGMEKITFGWYLKKILWIALVGYFAGIAVFMLMRNLI